MAGQTRYPDELRIDAEAQVRGRGYSVMEVAERRHPGREALIVLLAETHIAL